MVTDMKARDGRRVAESSAQSGFTLIELMVVVAIIGILAAIGVPQLTRFIRTSQTSEPAQTMGDMARTIQGWVDSRPSLTPGQLQNALSENNTLSASGDGKLDNIIPQMVLPASAKWSYEITSVTISSARVASMCIKADPPSGETGSVFYSTNPPDGEAAWDGNFYRVAFITSTSATPSGTGHLCG